MLFAVCVVVAQLDRDYIRDKTLEAQRAAASRNNHGGRPQVIDDDTLVFARPVRDTGVPISEIAKNSPSRPASTPRSPPCTGHWLITPSPSSRRPVLPNDDEPCRHGSLSLGRKVRSCSTADPYVRGVLTAAMRRGRLRRGDLSSFECQVFGAE